MSSELLKAQSNFISTEYIYSTFQNLSNISLVREFLQENKFGCFISALLITQFWLNKSIWWKDTFNTGWWCHRC